MSLQPQMQRVAQEHAQSLVPVAGCLMKQQADQAQGWTLQY